MKKIYLFILIGVLFTSCGEDGQDGDAYIQFSWDWYVDAYSDDNSGVPSTIREGVNYLVDPGKYNYEYYCSDGLGDYWSYSGTYTITINTGEDGSMFADGDDGEDSYFEFNLYGSGASFSSKSTMDTKISYLSHSEKDFSNYVKIIDGLSDTVLLVSNKANMLIIYQKYRLEKK